MQLYTYWRSTTSYRVRIALQMKDLAHESIGVDLSEGQQSSPEYLRLNHGAGVPVLITDDGQVLTQSLAILEWLDEVYPVPALLPTDPMQRARVKAAALTIATDIHPLNNLRVITVLKSMGHDQDRSVAWMHEWMRRGFDAFADLIKPDTLFCFGATPGLADVCLIPQLYNAHRWRLDLAPWPKLAEIEARCMALPAFQAAAPEAQPDAA